MALSKKTSTKNKGAKKKIVRLVAKRTELTRIADLEDEIIRLDQRFQGIEKSVAQLAKRIYDFECDRAIAPDRSEEVQIIVEGGTLKAKNLEEALGNIT